MTGIPIKTRNVKTDTHTQGEHHMKTGVKKLPKAKKLPVAKRGLEQILL